MAAGTSNPQERSQHRERNFKHAKDSVLRALGELTKILESSGNSFTGEPRRDFLRKFDALDRRLLSRLDLTAYLLIQDKREMKPRPQVPPAPAEVTPPVPEEVAAPATPTEEVPAPAETTPPEEVTE